MKQTIYLTFILLAGSYPVLFAQEKIQGTIYCNQKGIADIVVTDGKNFTTTDAEGKFTMGTDTKQKYIYYSLPSGYESPIEEGVPVFYQALDPQKNHYDFELLPVEKDQSRHTFVVWADPQVIDPEEFSMLDKVIDDIHTTQKSYNTWFHGISCGDIVFDRLNLYDDYKKTIAKMNFPFYQAVGNHDLDYTNRTDETSTQTYQSQFGPDYYSFNVGNIHYIVLDDVFYYGYSYHYMGYFPQNQLDWVLQDLNYVKKGSTVVIALHIPTYYTDANAQPGIEYRQKNSVINNRAFYEIVKGFDVHIMAGHSHTQWNTLISDSIFEHTHSAACAAWWQGEIGLDGTPKGYTVYEADGDQLKWYFKGVGLSKDHQFKYYPVGSDADNPDAFIVNVYNYDPLWKVEWYEDGVRMGEMDRYWGVDPLAKELYPPGKNAKYDWLGYEKTHHIFRAIPNNKESRIEVKVMDRFGNEWRLLDRWAQVADSATEQ